MKLLSIIAIAVYALPICGCRSADMPDTDSGKTHSKPEEARPVQVIARRFWQPKKQVLSLVRPMEQPECITIHHDGKSNYGRDWKASARRIRELQEGDIQTGHGDIRCHFIIDRGNIEAVSSQSENPDLTIEAPFEVWMDIMTNKADGQEMLVQQKYRVDGDLALLMRMSQLFGR